MFGLHNKSIRLPIIILFLFQHYYFKLYQEAWGFKLKTKTSYQSATCHERNTCHNTSEKTYYFPYLYNDMSCEIISQDIGLIIKTWEMLRILSKK